MKQDFTDIYHFMHIFWFISLQQILHYLDSETQCYLKYIDSFVCEEL